MSVEYLDLADYVAVEEIRANTSGDDHDGLRVAASANDMAPAFKSGLSGRVGLVPLQRLRHIGSDPDSQQTASPDASKLVRPVSEEGAQVLHSTPLDRELIVHETVQCAHHLGEQSFIDAEVHVLRTLHEQCAVEPRSQHVDVGEVACLGPAEQGSQFSTGEFLEVERRTDERRHGRPARGGINGELDDEFPVRTQNEKTNKHRSIVKPNGAPVSTPGCCLELVSRQADIGITGRSEEVEIVRRTVGQPCGEEASTARQDNPLAAGRPKNNFATST